MKVLTAAEMREVDRRTIELGIPGIVLMENAGAPRRGGYGGAIRAARGAADRGALREGQQRRRRPGDRAPVAHALPSGGARCGAARRAGGSEGRRRGELSDAARRAAARWRARFPAAARLRHLVVDALLGTGIAGPASGRMLDGIREINSGFPLAKVVAVDIPSGHAERCGRAGGRIRARRLHRDLHRSEDRARDAAELRPHGRVGGRRDRQPGGACTSRSGSRVVEPAMFRDTAGAAAARAGTKERSATRWWSPDRPGRRARRPWPASRRCARARGW